MTAQPNIKTISRHCDVESQKERFWRQNLWVTDKSTKVPGTDLQSNSTATGILISAQESSQAKILTH